MPIFQLLPCLALFLINTITKELSWYIQPTVDDHWCWSSRPFSGWHSESHIVLSGTSLLVVSLTSYLASCSAFEPPENAQVHPQTAFSCALRHAAGSCWSVTVKGSALRMFGWHPSLVHQMECCQRAFPWKPRVRSVVTLGTRNVFSTGRQKSTFSSPRSVFIWHESNIVLGVALRTLLLSLNDYFTPVVFSICALRTPRLLDCDKTNSHLVLKKVLI